MINAVAFAAFALDKRRAIHRQRRIPERTLLGLVLAGGGLGGIAAQQWLRHKTRKEPFRSMLLGITAAEVVALTAAVARGLV